MNKKGFSEAIIWVSIFIIVMLFFLSWGIYALWDDDAIYNIKKESCSKLGMEYYYTDGTEFCVDNNDQAHYVKFECEHYGFRKWECYPRIISIGEVRTIKNE